MAAMALGSAAASAYASHRGASMAQDASAWSTQRQMEFQEYMSNTAHQREVSDLRKAGLNPILSGTGGAGASTPGGGSFAGVDTLSGAVGSARESARATLEMDNMRATRKLLDSQRIKTDEDAVTSKYAGLLHQQHYRESQTRQSVGVWQAAREFNLALEAASSAKMRELDLAVARAAQKGRLDQAAMESSDLYKGKRYLDAGLESLGKATSGVIGGAIAGAIAGRGSSARSRSRGPVITPYRRTEPVLPRRLR